ncbi:DNA polymerase IV [Natranaerobius trueperi]|uniref:DNA polymerase IV n=1 Tax=Natranaerobius trueperi TaxID=759412 RepID=A0A226C160_9FIRM|nr:DNA polymerase IV [Natranaerobius trueperi]OWZ84915.1 DNA polymerase IV [Natranaerobius trueperi]
MTTPTKKTRQIIHIDMDAFFAAVEIRDNPKLKDKPVIIGGGKRGVVSTCCYNARKYGIRSAMPIYRAKRLCPHGVFLSPNRYKYEQASKNIHEIFYSYTPLVEPLSLDEAFLDVTGSISLFGSAVSIGKQIKKEIKKKLHLTCSVGIATNKFVSKVASDLKKPSGFIHIPPGKEKEFLAPLPVEKLWGVGEKTTNILKQNGFYTIGDLQKKSPYYLVENKTITKDLLMLSKGIDHRKVIPEEEPKSIGQEKTFEKDLSPGGELIPFLLKFSEQVGARLRKEGYRGKTVTVKIRNSQFKTRTKQKTVNATDQDQDIFEYAKDLVKDLSLGKSEKIRLLGVTVSNLTPNSDFQLTLEDPSGKNKKLQSALDQVREKFGDSSLKRATTITSQQEQK